LHYPFSFQKETGERKFTWPPTEKYMIFEKLDGTNINIYRYLDADGKTYVTYKTRLTPVVSVTKFGDFRKMWGEMLEKYPELKCPEKVINGEYSLAFEMYGYQNLILTVYKEPLEVKFLFAVDQKTGCVYPPDKNILDTKTINQDFTMLPGSIEENYNGFREIANQKNLKIQDTIVAEGYVFYTQHLDENKIEWKMWKCKPPQVEDIHWQSDYIDDSAIFTTVKNALENVDPEALTPDFVEELLAEEFTKEKIEKSRARIATVTYNVITQAIRMRKVKEFIEKCPKEVIDSRDKRTIMRWISQYFQKQEMTKVYHIMHGAGFVN